MILATCVYGMIIWSAVKDIVAEILAEYIISSSPHKNEGKMYLMNLNKF